MRSLTIEEKKVILEQCRSTMHSNFYNHRQFEEAAIRVAETQAYEAASFSSFERWHEVEFPDAYRLSKRKYQLLKFVEVRQDVAKFVENESLQISLPTNESQTRALAPLPAEERGPAYVLAHEQANGERVTGAVVAQTVASLKPAPTLEQATHRRIGNLEVDRTAKPPPQPKSDLPPKSFRVFDFSYNANYQTIYFKVFKPEVPSKGWKEKKEHCKIRLVDLLWELRNCGFQLTRIGTANSDAEGNVPEQEEEEEPYPSLAGRDLSQVRPSAKPANVATEALSLMLGGDHDDAPAASFTAGMDFTDIDAMAKPFEDYPQ